MELLPNNISYEKWLGENKEKVLEYAKKNDLPLKDVQMTSRAYNILRMNGKNYMSDIVLCTANEIAVLDKMNREAANEILMFKRNYLRNHKKSLLAFVVNGAEHTSKPSKANFQINKNNSVITKIDSKEKSGFVKPEIKLQPKRSPYYIKLLLADKLTKKKIIEFITVKNIEISNLEVSPRTYNALRRGDVRFLHEALAYYPDRFTEFRNMGTKTIEEICGAIENSVFEQYDSISLYIENDEVSFNDSIKKSAEEETNPYKLTILELIEHPVFKDKAIQYIKENNISIHNMGLGIRAVNALVNSNIMSFYDALSIYPYELSSLRNIGVKSINQIKDRMEYYISKMQNAVSAYCIGDIRAMYTTDYVCDVVMSCFENVGFVGISMSKIEEKFPAEIDKSLIKNGIDDLIKNKKIMCFDEQYHRVFPSVYSVIKESHINDESKKIVLKKLSGLTFEAISLENGITRERIRQRFDNTIRKLRSEMQFKYGFSTFNEDYYEYLFCNYDISKEVWFDYIGVDEKIYRYLSTVFSKGKKRIEDTVKDSLVDSNIKFNIEKYLNRNRLYIDGVLIEKHRSTIECYALSKIACDELSFDEFAVLYNELLKENGIEFDEKLYYTPDVLNTRKNRLSESKYCLWKHGEKLRYYDISKRDYIELFEALNLERFVDSEVSTLDLFYNNTAVMLKYDIRDHYELHNLLKKIMGDSKYDDIVFQRQPMIKFGKSNDNQVK